eukprot:352263-Chlamydomonas_euryale.AAC.3
MAQEAPVCPAAHRPAPPQVKHTAKTRGLKSGSIQDHQPLPAQRQTKAKVPPAATARPVGVTVGGLPALLGAAPAASHGRPSG